MSVVPPRIRRPTPSEIQRKAEKHFISLSEAEAKDFERLIDESLTAYERLDEMAEPELFGNFSSRDSRSGHKPVPGSDPYNAVVTSCSVNGAEEGPLAGYTVGLKDNVQLAGIEMTCGSRLLRGFYPSVDATVATRLLEAGADITAKLNMEAWATSSTGDQSATGPVLNPHDSDYLAGGSSSGSAVAVVTERVDLAVGTDQAGSIRMPAAMCGCVGLKPTFGLVPYTGVVPISPTVDHAGPLTRSVTDCALVLEVMAGADPLDHRSADTPTSDYVTALDADPTGCRVGLLTEGFGLEASDARVDEAVREAAEAFGEAGATVQDVSVPAHLDGKAIRNAVVTGEHTALVNAEGLGHYMDGWYDTGFAEAFGRARRVHADDFPLVLKLRLVLGQYLADEYLGHYHAKAQNLRRDLGAAYDEVLSKIDVLAMPTVPGTAPERVDELTRLEFMARVRGNSPNTSPFNVTGHPAISVPCGSVDGLPVGIMFVGNQLDDGTVLRVADAFEQAIDVDLGDPSV